MSAGGGRGETITTEAIAAWLRAFAAVAAENREYLTELDAAIGDGDHGINMDRGMRAVATKLGDGESANGAEVSASGAGSATGAAGAATAAADIGALLKLKGTHTNDTLADKGTSCRISPIIFPLPMLATAIMPITQG
ncbi:MAG: DAK2 domain-containing protein, partial [Actinomycetes bacterium]